MLKTYLKHVDELNQHLTQLQGVLDYLSVGFGENERFLVDSRTVANMFWTAETLLENAITSAKELHEVSLEAFKAGTAAKLQRIEKQRLQQALGGEDE